MRGTMGWWWGGTTRRGWGEEWGGDGVRMGDGYGPLLVVLVHPLTPTHTHLHPLPPTYGPHLVVLLLGQREVGEVPPYADARRSAEEAELGERLLGRGQQLDREELRVEVGEGEGAEHAEDPHVVVESRAEEPLVHGRVLWM